MKGNTGDIEDRLEIDEMWVRSLMTMGVIVWGAASVASLLRGAIDAFTGFGIIAFFVAGVLLIGLSSERLATFALGIGTVLLTGWGVLQQWDIGVWLAMGVTVILPAVVSSALYSYADQEERLLEHAESATERRRPTRMMRA